MSKNIVMYSLEEWWFKNDKVNKEKAGISAALFFFCLNKVMMKYSFIFVNILTNSCKNLSDIQYRTYIILDNKIR